MDSKSFAKIVGVTVAVTLALCLGLYFWQLRRDDTELEQLKKEYTHKQTALMQELLAERKNRQVAEDSILTLNKKLDAKKIEYITINKRYDAKVDSIIRLPLDDQVRFLADWLSKGVGL